MSECPLLAHSPVRCTCPLSGAKRTWESFTALPANLRTAPELANEIAEDDCAVGGHEDYLVRSVKALLE
jgi:hypothetical protein